MVKEYKDLTITDDFMFWTVLTNNLNLCKELIELILDIKIREISLAEGQKVIEHKYDSRGIKLDVYIEDESNTVYVLEMQVVLKKDLPKRTRYYQGMIDLNLIKRGALFKELNDSYIIFICTADPFGRGLPIYTFESYCNQDKSIKLSDGTVKAMVNPNSDRTGLSDEMNGFLDLLQGKSVREGLAKKLSDAVDKAKEHTEWEVEYMTLALKLAEEREEGREEGRLEGKDEGNLLSIKNIMETLNLTCEAAMEALKLSNEDKQRYRELIES